MSKDFITAPLAMANSRYVVAVTKLVTLQTQDENRERLISRGLYGFQKLSLAKHFTNACNDATEKDTAYLFRKSSETINPKHKEAQKCLTQLKTL